MARRKESPQKAAMREMMKGYLKENDISIKDGTDVNAVMRDMMSVLLEGVLDEELGYSKYDYRNKDTGNSRNGHSTKTMHTSYGDMEMAVPRDRNGDYEPQLIKKYQNTVTQDMEEKILSMYAKGMTTGDIESQMKELYDIDISDSTKSEDGDRWLPLTERAKGIIRRIEAINEEYSHQYKDFLFVKDGKCLTPDAVDAQIKRGCEHIGIPVKAMHKIRKTYASTLLHNGVNLSIVKDMLGHADESTTLKHYIYNIEGSTETDNKVLNALDPQNDAKSDQGDQNIIQFTKIKRAENPDKSTLSAL